MLVQFLKMGQWDLMGTIEIQQGCATTGYKIKTRRFTKNSKILKKSLGIAGLDQQFFAIMCF